MKVMFRPDREWFEESVSETKIFNSLYEMFEYVSSIHKCRDIDNVCIYFRCIETRLCTEFYGFDYSEYNDKFDWRGKNYLVCVDNAFGENYLKKFNCPQAVGYCKFVEESKLCL